MITMKAAKTFIFFTALTILASCTTTVTGEFERPSLLDMNGASSIAVLDIYIQENRRFDPWNYSREYSTREKEELASYLAKSLEDSIAKKGYLTIASASETERALKKRTVPPCDAYITGTISSWEDRTERKVREDDEGKEKSYYIRKLSFTLTFDIFDAQTKKELGSRRYYASGSSYETESRYDLPKALRLVRNDLDRSVTDLSRAVSPYKERESYSLIKDKKNPSLQKAYELASDGKLEEAQKLYSEYYEQSGSYKAGYNAAMILQAQGKLSEAKKLLDDVASRRDDKKISSALRVLNRELESARKAELQKDKRQKKNPALGSEEVIKDIEDIKDAGLIVIED